MTTAVLRRTYGRIALSAALPLLGCVGAEPAQVESRRVMLPEFERELEGLREELRIPGMSAAVARDGEVVWARGFGWADLERRVPAEAGSIYQLASLTKPFTATVLLQLADEGRLDLDARASEFGLELEEADEVRISHILSHTVSTPPGTRYRYDGYAFGELGKVIEQVTGRPFAVELTERIIRPLGLRSTAPNPHDEKGALTTSGLDQAYVEQHLVTGYAFAWGRSIWPLGLFGPMRPIGHPTSFHTSAGLVASAPDVARFSIALDEGELLSRSSRDRAMRPWITPAGDTLPYGLGWFVQDYRGTKLVWHYGHWFGSSALIIKAPEERLTFALLANSDGLSRRRGLGDHGDLTKSPAARLFLRTFLGS